VATRGGDRSLLRRINLLATLRSTREAPRTIAALATATGLSRTAAEAVVLDLVALGWLAEDGQGGHPGAGPRATTGCAPRPGPCSASTSDRTTSW
jgi:DNA-binding IclR family transcriptional regulator